MCLKNAREQPAFRSTTEKMGARRSCDFPPNEKNYVTTIQSSSDAENATAGIMKNAREKPAFCST